MGYINDFEKDLEKRLVGLERVWQEGDVTRSDEAISAVIKFVKEKVLESYRNGSEKKQGNFNGGRRFPARSLAEARRS
jgi:hypothetical protein